MKDAWEFLMRLPTAVRTIGMIGASMAAGAMLVVHAVGIVPRVRALEAAVLGQRLPERVDRIENEHRGLAYLICRAAREDEGKDPRDCRLLIRGMDAYLRDLER